MSSGSSPSPMPESRPAVKESRPVRLAFEGPSGSGRTLTSLLVAAQLGAPIALIDTERGMAAKYADRVPFGTQEFTHYDPTSLFAALAHAAMGGYPVLVVDTYSAFWSGAGGMLDKVDGEARAGYGGTHAGWSKHRPMERAVTEALAAYPGHVIVTLKARTDTVIETDTHGRQYARRISVRPEQRADIEYDFDAVGTLGPVATMHWPERSSSSRARTSAALSSPGPTTVSPTGPSGPSSNAPATRTPRSTACANSGRRSSPPAPRAWQHSTSTTSPSRSPSSSPTAAGNCAPSAPHPSRISRPHCCPALKMPTKAAFTMPTNCDGDAPPVGVPAGRSSVRCRFRRQGAGGSVPVSGLRF